MNLAPLLDASPAIQIHVAAAVAAMLLGAAILFRRKGDAAHRLAGRIWVLLMVVVAVSSFFIWTIRLWGIWSPIHLLSVGTLVSLAYAIGMARVSNIVAHRRTMQATYAGALVVTGFFTLLPGRIMNEVLFGGDRPLVGIVALGALVTTGAALAVRGSRPRRSVRA
jgi:uncharacterized membrane protein